jgi:hypothetical protein
MEITMSLRLPFATFAVAGAALAAGCGSSSNGVFSTTTTTSTATGSTTGTTSTSTSTSTAAGGAGHGGAAHGGHAQGGAAQGGHAQGGEAPGGGGPGGSGGGTQADCQAGATRACYTGPAGTQNVGACKGGTQSCVVGAWGACNAETTPASETCNGVDDDCDGQVDDGVSGTGGACSTGLPGVCATGTIACTAGKLVCVGDAGPSLETCNGLDDDCDGLVDDGNPGGGGACPTGLPGACGQGVEACSGGVLVCQALVAPSQEKCNGVDDDCNGLVDDGNPGGGQFCATGLPGVCSSGTTLCQGGVVVCSQNVAAAAAETCGNGLDDNCNGVVDDGCGPYTFAGVAVNLPVAQLVGWQQCFSDTYAQTVALSTVTAACFRQKLLLACRTPGSQTLTVAAWAPRADVLFNTGTSNTPHNANGVGWYYYQGDAFGTYSSWGFAPQGDVINRNSCDTTASSLDGYAGADANKRLCWHTQSSNLIGGWRCGATDSLNASGAWERVVFQAD